MDVKLNLLDILVMILMILLHFNLYYYPFFLFSFFFVLSSVSFQVDFMSIMKLLFVFLEIPRK